MRPKDKVSLIGAPGIGRRRARVRARGRVMCADVNAEGAEAVARQIADTGGGAASVRVDVTQEAEVQDDLADSGPLGQARCSTTTPESTAACR
jgi:3-hydroxybutyrate dehydrogenase